MTWRLSHDTVTEKESHRSNSVSKTEPERKRELLSSRRPQIRRFWEDEQWNN